ncbi:MAG: bifunctional hydroxymethylpyrimidine kinase/phosphomethylpyrimidine kinase [Planctomycetes bacterium]|nr:bifunctional hydroxymethylpyrimidine kinase/phosphomethylpyrimidine kinase [Planctomycetota bacterium]
MTVPLSFPRSLLRARLAVCGDFALDAHWELAEEAGAPSLETGLAVRRVSLQRYELGGAARVAAHLSALRVQRAVLVGAIGRDPFGAELRSRLELPSLRTGALIHRNDWSTLVYGKPQRSGVEQERLDFGSWDEPSAALRALLLQHLGAAARRSDLVILNQQVAPGLLGPALVDALNALVAAHPERRFLADCRERLGELRGVVAKCNAREARALLASEEREALVLARALAQQRAALVFVTDGERGLAWATPDAASLVAPPFVVEHAEACGAGDAVTAALGAALASGATPDEAARFATGYAAEALRSSQRARPISRRASRSTS